MPADALPEAWSSEPSSAMAISQNSSPNESILDSTKKALGLDAEYDVFDPDIVMHINSVFFTLNQLGVGPVDGFAIAGTDDAWDTFLGGDPRLNAVKSYVYLRVRLLFDPPANSFGISAMEKQISEFEWRLNVHVENQRV